MRWCYETLEARQTPRHFGGNLANCLMRRRRCPLAPRTLRASPRSWGDRACRHRLLRVATRLCGMAVLLASESDSGHSFVARIPGSNPTIVKSPYVAVMSRSESWRGTAVRRSPSSALQGRVVGVALGSRRVERVHVGVIERRLLLPASNEVWVGQYRAPHRD